MVRAVPFLDRLIQEDIRSLELLLEKLVFGVTFQDGEEIMQKGQPSNYVLFSVSNTSGHDIWKKPMSAAELKKARKELTAGNTPDDFVVQVVGTGTVLGESVIHESKEESVRSAYVYALGNPEYIKLSKTALPEIADSNTLAAKLLKRHIEIRSKGIPEAVGFSSLFSSLEIPTLESILADEDNVSSAEIDAGDYIIRQKDKLDNVFIVLSGIVDITIHQASAGGSLKADATHLTTLDSEEIKGLTLGEMSLVDESDAAKNNVVARTPATILKINKSYIKHLIEKYPQIKFSLQILSAQRELENKQTLESKALPGAEEVIQLIDSE